MSTQPTTDNIAEIVLNSDVAKTLEAKTKEIVESVDPETLTALTNDLAASDKSPDAVQAVMEKHIEGLGDDFAALSEKYTTLLAQTATKHGISIEELREAVQEKTAERLGVTQENTGTDVTQDSPTQDSLSTDQQQQQEEQVVTQQQQQQQQEEDKKTQEEKEKQEQEQKDILSALPPEMGAIVAVIFAIVGMAEKFQENEQEQDVAQDGQTVETTAKGSPRPVDLDAEIEAANEGRETTQQTQGDNIPVPGAVGGYIDPSEIEFSSQQETSTSQETSNVSFDNSVNFQDLLDKSGFEVSTGGFSGGTFDFEVQQINSIEETTLSSVPNVGGTTDKFLG